MDSVITMLTNAYRSATAIAIISGASVALASTPGTDHKETTDISNPDMVEPTIINGTIPDPDDWRFDAVAAFGKTDLMINVDNYGNHFGNGTLISRDTVLMAEHILDDFNLDQDNQPDPDFFSFRFRRNPDGSLGTTDAGWDSFYHVGVSHFTFPDPDNDTLIAHLSEPVMHIDPICIGDASSLTSSDEIIVSGWGRRGPNQGDGPLGELRLADPPIIFVTSTHIIYRQHNDPLNPCACGGNNNDSGGGLFVEIPTQSQSALPEIELVATVHNYGSASIASTHQLINPNTCFCKADLYKDGTLDIFDSSRFVELFNQMSPYADWNGDGIFDVFDALGFIEDFNNGCP
ncbi:MAG: GC-type dockerin domain-anchored protein [Phycisphaerales bacterium]